jgi:hypothetical protein
MTHRDPEVRASWHEAGRHEMAKQSLRVAPVLLGVRRPSFSSSGEPASIRIRMTSRACGALGGRSPSVMRS